METASREINCHDNSNVIATASATEHKHKIITILLWQVKLYWYWLLDLLLKLIIVKHRLFVALRQTKNTANSLMTVPSSSLVSVSTS